MLYSVITPVYNREDCIGRCIESVIKQLHSEILLEHIIVDDGSSDNTVQIVKRYAQDYPHIKFIKFAHNQGTNAARNAAINCAKGKFCIILDSDDYFVDNAINLIESIRKRHSNYIHYLFSPDDMVTKYRKNPILKEDIELQFYDFLLGKVQGDFVHIILTDTLKKYPFDESLRIFEGVFFLRFYKEAQHILFTNKIVTIRERSRQDSVTRSTFRTNKNIIERSIKAIDCELNWFLSDLEKIKAFPRIYELLSKKLENTLLIENYKSAKEIICQMQNMHYSIHFKYAIIYKLRLGYFFRLALKFYLVIKYSIFRKKLN